MREDIQDIYLLSPLQEGMLFHSAYNPELREYVEQISFNVRGNLNVPTFQKAWQYIVDRNEVLRTSFHWEGLEKPVQVVRKSVKLPIYFQDLKYQLPAQQAEQITSYFRVDRQRSFDLSEPPLLRLAVFRLNDVSYQVVLTFHHVIIDGWSLSLVFNEFAAAQEAFHRVGKPELPSRRPYKDYITWLGEQDLAEAEFYWRRLLSGYKGASRMWVARAPAETLRDAGSGERQLCLPKQLAEALQKRGREHQLTLNTLVQGAWALLMGMYTQQRDVVFGTVVSGRPPQLDGVESMVGLFINTLPTRVDLSSDQTLVQWLKDLQKQQLESRLREFSPLVSIQKWSEIPHGTSFFDSVIVFNNFPTLAQSNGQQGRTDVLVLERLSHPVSIIVSPGADILIRVLYSKSHFDPHAIESIAEHLERLFEAFVSEPQRRLGDFEHLTPQEQQLVRNWSAAEAAGRANCSLIELFEDQVRRTPEAEAVSERRERASYAELNGRANRLAHYLRSLGVGAESVVGFCLERSVDAVATMLAIQKAGGAYLPLDPAYPPERLRSMIEDAGARVVVTNGEWAERVFPASSRLVLLDQVAHILAGQGDDNSQQSLSPESAAYVIYTSGSTGRPKGVVGLHGATVNRLQWMWAEYPYAEDSVGCQKTALSFVDSVWETFGGLLRGVRTIILNQNEVTDIEKLIERLREEGVTRIVLVPSLLSALLGSRRELGADLPKLREWFVSGEELPSELSERFRDCVPLGRLINLYGSSEVAGDATYHEVGFDGVAIGRPITNCSVYVLDDEMRLLPPAVPGEIYVGGAGLARGYVGRPDLTAERFLPDCYSDVPGSRMYRTGDLGRWRTDGTIEFIGRRDQQIKVRGHRIELGEIETQLKTHPAVKDCVAVARPDDAGEQQLVAYVAPRMTDMPDQIKPAGQPSIGSSGGESERVSQWHSVWDETYRNSAPFASDFNIVGWNSSYTGGLISAEEMHEWVDRTTERILSLQPRRVLEIACGTGLLLLRIAPHCDRYVGSDISQQALDYVERQLNEPGRSSRPVSLMRRAADDFDGLDEQSFDAVILNSVVQYFPNVKYLFRVIDGALKLVRPGGFIFVGDIRSLPLLEALQTSIVLERAEESSTLAELRQLVRYRLAQEEELALDPALFPALMQHFACISHVDVQLKRGKYHNELNRFRYDAVLHVGDRKLTADHPYERLYWYKNRLDCKAVRHVLAANRPERLGIFGIPNRRLSPVLDALRAVRAGDDRDTAAAVRRASRSAGSQAADPEDFWSIGDDLQCDVSLRWSPSRDDGAFDVLFTRSRDSSDVSSRAFDDELGFPIKAWTQYANNPLKTVMSRNLVPELKEHLRERLPDYMVPGSFLLLDEMPLTPNGKIDRRSLPSVDAVGRRGESRYVEPRTATEESLVQIWRGLLGATRIGTTDNFFEIGGHSIRAMQLISRIRETFGVTLPLRAVFDAPTISALAQLIETQLPHSESVESTERPIASLDRGAYRIRTSLP
jgi:amino acid adenylation domain-containing protein